MFPYTDGHQLNLDWVVTNVTELKAALEAGRLTGPQGDSAFIDSIIMRYAFVPYNTTPLPTHWYNTVGLAEAAYGRDIAGAILCTQIRVNCHTGEIYYSYVVHSRTYQGKDGVPSAIEIQNAVDEYLTDHPTVTGTFTNAAKHALIALLGKVAYIDEHGQEYLDTLEQELFAVTVSSISAVFNPGANVIYTTDTLESLKQYLTVTATYTDSTTEILADSVYTLSGTMVDGANTITVSYGGKTDTFTVNCIIRGWLYHFNQSILSSGENDFGLTGNAVYSAGRLGTDYAYSHIIPTPGTSSSDTQYGLKAVSLSNSPNFSGDFTISFWAATQSNFYMHPFTFCKYSSASTASERYFSNISVVASGWNYLQYAAGNGYAGLSIYAASANRDIIITMHSQDLTKSSQLRFRAPSTIDTTTWHHYAFTKKNSTFRFFFDGIEIANATAESTLYNAAQVAISSNFVQSAESYDEIQQMPNGEKMQDLYIADFCKWDSAFNPQTITY